MFQKQGIFIFLVVFICTPSFTANSQDFVKTVSGTRWHYVSEKGKVDKLISYDTVISFEYGWAPVMYKGKWGCIDHKNKWVLAAEYEDLMIINAELIRFRSTGLYGIIDRGGRIRLPPEFDRIDHFRHGYGTVNKNGTWFSLTPEGLSTDNIIFENPDVKAIIVGCGPDEPDCSYQQMARSIFPEIRYPARARENGIQGTVVLSALIDTAGNMTDRRVQREVYTLLDEEAMRVFALMDFQWIPAKVNGQPVVSRIFFPLKFYLDPRRR